MSRRAATTRAKAKKDDLAKAAAEVLNTITTAPPPPSAVASRPAISGGLLRNATEEGDVDGDLQPKQLQLFTEQDLSPPPPSHHKPLLLSSRFDSFPVVLPQSGGIEQTGVATHGGGGGGGYADGASDGDGGGGIGGQDGGGVSGSIVDPAEIYPPPRTIPTADRFTEEPTGLEHSAADQVAPASKAVAAATRPSAFIGSLVRFGRRACHAASRIYIPDPQYLLLAAKRAHPSTISAAAVAVLLLLVSMLVLSASSYSLARRTSHVQMSLGQELSELRQHLQDWRQQSADLAADIRTELRDQLRGVRLEAQRSGLQIAELRSDMEAVVQDLEGQATEVRSLRRAVEAHNAVRSIVHPGDAGDWGVSGDTGASDGWAPELVSKMSTRGAGTEGAALAMEGLGAADSDLQGLPACHVRRMVAAAGPLLAARVTRHSPVIGDEAALMRFHAAMSPIFAPGSGSRIHPLARQLTNAATTPMCLPLATPTEAKRGGGGATTFLELQLLMPANVSAISFRYPAYGTWDTSSALFQLSAIIYEVPAAAAAAAAASITGSVTATAQQKVAGSGVAPPSSSPSSSIGGSTQGLRSREVVLQPLRGLECQHVTIPSGSPDAPAAVNPGAAAGRYGSDDSRMLVHGITIHVHTNFGNPDYSCMPRVLVHGWGL